MRSTVTLAKKFVDLLLLELDAKDFIKVLYRNAEPEYESTGSCASHDFCDANMVMLDAWGYLGYGEFDPNSSADASVWNDAWHIAKRQYLTRTKGVL